MPKANYIIKCALCTASNLTLPGATAFIWHYRALSCQSSCRQRRWAINRLARVYCQLASSHTGTYYLKRIMFQALKINFAFQYCIIASQWAFRWHVFALSIEYFILTVWRHWLIMIYLLLDRWFQCSQSWITNCRLLSIWDYAQVLFGNFATHFASAVKSYIAFCTIKWSTVPPLIEEAILSLILRNEAQNYRFKYFWQSFISQFYQTQYASIEYLMMNVATTAMRALAYQKARSMHAHRSFCEQWKCR